MKRMQSAPQAFHTETNMPQLLAIRHRDGPAMVLAGPGSGKTYVITQRLRYMIEEYGIPPQQILVVTFSKSAAIEMQSRFYQLTKSRYPEVTFGTFHSIFFQILRNSIHTYPNELMTNEQKIGILRQSLQNLGLATDPDTEWVLLMEIARYKNDKRADFKPDPSLVYAEHFASILQEYQKLARELHRIDFDDMTPDCLHLLETSPGILEKYRERFRYFLVDEYQDINRLQFLCLQKLTQPGNHLFVVGDDDQSIYGFRGSKPEFMLRFKEFYPQAKEFLLNFNYRSHDRILQIANQIIMENQTRFSKHPEAVNSYPGEVCEVQARTFETEEGERRLLCRYLIAHPKSLTESAILFRTNTECSRMAESLAEAGIPFCCREKLRSFYEEAVCMDLFAYLRLASGRMERADFLRVMNKPLRYISREALARGGPFSSQMVLHYYQQNAQMYRRVELLLRQCRMAGKMRSHLAIGYVVSGMGYDRYLRTTGQKADYLLAKESVNRLVEEAKETPEIQEFLDGIVEKKKKIKQALENSRSLNVERKGVRLMTMHAAKGLEFDTVFLPSLNEGVLPSRHAVSIPEIEEERRLLYVAVTRARKRLYLSFVSGEKDAGGGTSRLPSRFLRPVLSLFQEEEM